MSHYRLNRVKISANFDNPLRLECLSHIINLIYAVMVMRRGYSLTYIVRTRKLEIKDIENFYPASINLRDVLKFALEYILMLK